MAKFDMWPPHFSLWPPLGEGGSDPPLRVIRTAAEPHARALGAPPPPCRQTTSWQPMIAKLAGVVPKVTLSNPSGSVSPVPGKTESFAPMLLHCSFETTWRNLCASKDTHALGPQILRCFLANVSDLSSFSSS